MAGEVGGYLRGAVRHRAPGSVVRGVHQEERARDEEGVFGLELCKAWGVWVIP